MSNIIEKRFLNQSWVALPQNLLRWSGIEYLYLSPDAEKNRSALLKKYTQSKGQFEKISIQNDSIIAYDDHVSRIQSKKSLGTAIFTKPKLSIHGSHCIDIKHMRTSSSDIKKIDTIANQYPHLKEIPHPFDYEHLENDLKLPVCIDVPGTLGGHFILNESGDITENVLHLPIKITKSKTEELKTEGRVLSDQHEINHWTIYLPQELISLTPLIEYVALVEMKYNPYFLEEYFIFLSISHSQVEPGTTQRRGGWHIDGHQGYERVQPNNQKLPCDRQYTISNVLPTQYILHSFNFDNVRAYCKNNCYELDNVNMQDVIEFQASNAEIADPNKVRQLIPNRLFFLNPYMVHRAATNHFSCPVTRTFVRILCSTYGRDRLGDTINPLIGPIYPLKVKTIVDIHEMNQRFM